MSGCDQHAEIRAQLALVAAGALDAEAEARVTRHAATCASCAAELEDWRLIADGLRRLPTPQPSPALYERTRSMVVGQLAEQTARRENRTVLILLVIFSWVVTVLSWPVFRFAAGGLLSVLDIRFQGAWLLFGIFTGLTWLAGGSAALLLSVRRQQEGRLAL
jgi:anti-sigma factor RsiW